MGIYSDVQKLEVGALVELFELDATEIGGQVLRFHGYTQVGPIWWQGQQYDPWAIRAEGFEQVGEGQQPSPTLSVGNIGQDEKSQPVVGVISALCIHLDDLVGARVAVRRTLGKYLDAANFADGNPTADPQEELPPEIWIVQQKTAETAEVVEFSLSSALDFNGQKLPDRPIIAGVCSWLRKGGYRGPYCGYTGSRMFDLDGKPVSDPTLDRCSGLMSDCKKRFGEYEVINFGGFPSADLVRG
ncbi:phage minor tail protein L [Achromobacter xylosoxidans]|uniref:Phage minor tail protein L n=1 Tax=Alcaligenes xylosoxydans xylosoxydans TaxID=85698 RepID=A0A0X8P206_ALCXX|nr:phage minor tail protein L [Achromobacter xylosoxidans]AMG38456.1 phage minor tail protein L [Achromobacter xylosoxidans]